jgi:hypothetical protein
MQQNHPVEEGRPFGFYFLMFFLFFLTTMIGWNFGHIPGALIGFTFAAIVNTYALQIKLD